MNPITVFTARKVITMDPGRPAAEAVAVVDGKVLSTQGNRLKRGQADCRSNASR